MSVVESVTIYLGLNEGDIAADSDAAYEMVHRWVKAMEESASWNHDTIMTEIGQESGYYSVDPRTGLPMAQGFISADLVFDTAAEVIGRYGNPGAAELAQAIRERKGEVTVETGYEKGIAGTVVEPAIESVSEVADAAAKLPEKAWNLAEWWTGLKKGRRNAIVAGGVSFLGVILYGVLRGR